MTTATELARGRTPLKARGLVVLIIVSSIFVLLVAVTAVRSSLGLIRLPIELYLLDQNLPAIFRLHMAASGLALGFGLLTILLQHKPARHRPLGRLTAALVAIGGLMALPSALYSEATAMARTGFFAQGLVWLALLGAGIVAIRARDIVRHRRAMLAMYAVATGAIWLRIATAATSALALPFDAAYAIAAWLGWLIPLGLVWWMTRKAAARDVTAPVLAR